MNMHTKLSTKGQVVLPKSVRDQLNWQPGQELEVVQHPGGLTLRATPVATSGETAEVILARIAARNTYRGPRISDADIRRAVMETAAERDEATRLR